MAGVLRVSTTCVGTALSLQPQLGRKGSILGRGTLGFGQGLKLVCKGNVEKCNWWPECTRFQAWSYKPCPEGSGMGHLRVLTWEDLDDPSELWSKVGGLARQEERL